MLQSVLFSALLLTAMAATSHAADPASLLAAHAEKLQKPVHIEYTERETALRSWFEHNNTDTDFDAAPDVLRKVGRLFTARFFPARPLRHDLRLAPALWVHQVEEIEDLNDSGKSDLWSFTLMGDGQVHVSRDDRQRRASILSFKPAVGFDIVELLTLVRSSERGRNGFEMLPLDKVLPKDRSLVKTQKQQVPPAAEQTTYTFPMEGNAGYQRRVSLTFGNQDGSLREVRLGLSADADGATVNYQRILFEYAGDFGDLSHVIPRKITVHELIERPFTKEQMAAKRTREETWRHHLGESVKEIHVTHVETFDEDLAAGRASIPENYLVLNVVTGQSYTIAEREFPFNGRGE
ncbi:MAG: hypothetical protein ACO1TE_00580 [Prosthecobacter sp.]